MAFIGYKLDQNFNPDGFLYTILGMFLGLSWGFYDVFKKIKLLDK